MLHYEQFESNIIAEFGNDATIWRHVLPAVPLAHRLRFLQTMRSGFSVTESFDMIMLSQTLNEQAYEQFVEEAVGKKMSRTKTGANPTQGRNGELYSLVI